MMKVNLLETAISQYKLALLEGLGSLGYDTAKITERITQGLRTVQIKDKITFVQSFEKMLFLATASGSIRIIDFASQSERVMEKVHLAVKLLAHRLF